MDLTHDENRVITMFRTSIFSFSSSGRALKRDKSPNKLIGRRDNIRWFLVSGIATFVFSFTIVVLGSPRENCLIPIKHDVFHYAFITR